MMHHGAYSTVIYTEGIGHSNPAQCNFVLAKAQLDTPNRSPRLMHICRPII
jgi:hypothetical protein